MRQNESRSAFMIVRERAHFQALRDRSSRSDPGARKRRPGRYTRKDAGRRAADEEGQISTAGMVYSLM